MYLKFFVNVFYVSAYGVNADEAVAGNKFIAHYHQFFGLGISGGIMRYHVGNTLDKHIFYAGTGESSSNELMRIVGDGRVGIGVTSPGAMLEIARGTLATAPFGSLQVNGTTYASHFNYGIPEDTYIRGGKASANVIINDYGDHGNVGIGTATPTEKLDVNGNVDVSGSVEIGYTRVFGNVVNVPGFTYGSASCNCASGFAIGGGFIVNDNAVEVLKSYANGDASWTVYMYNSGGAARTLQAFVICARLAN